MLPSSSTMLSEINLFRTNPLLATHGLLSDLSKEVVRHVRHQFRRGLHEDQGPQFRSPANRQAVRVITMLNFGEVRSVRAKHLRRRGNTSSSLWPLRPKTPTTPPASGPRKHRKAHQDQGKSPATFERRLRCDPAAMQTLSPPETFIT